MPSSQGNSSSGADRDAALLGAAPKLSTLLERVEAATGADRELDGQLEVLARWKEAARAGLKPEHRARWRSSASGHISDGFTNYDARAFTASLDAALALVERVLPGWSALIDTHAPHARVRSPRLHEDVGSFGATPALALLAALLKALSSDHGDGVSPMKRHANEEKEI